jgi:DNA (cytosine-5)-methyltransferase 1
MSMERASRRDATPVPKLRVLDLFSGIGGFSLGLERTGGFETVAFCEIDPFCQRVLRKHWPEVPIYDDIRSLPAIRADVVTAGFPCQPGSSAARGRDKGRSHPSWLWPHVPSAIRASGARWFIGENVTHLDKRPWLALDQVVAHLASIDFEVGPPLEIPACAFGHDHWRPRLWILGYSDGNSQPDVRLDAEVAGMPWGRPDTERSREAHGLSRGLDAYRRSALGNAVVPQVPEAIGRAILAARASMQGGEA